MLEYLNNLELINKYINQSELNKQLNKMVILLFILLLLSFTTAKLTRIVVNKEDHPEEVFEYFDDKAIEFMNGKKSSVEVAFRGILMFRYGNYDLDEEREREMERWNNEMFGHY